MSRTQCVSQSATVALSPSPNSPSSSRGSICTQSVSKKANEAPLVIELKVPSNEGSSIIRERSRSPNHDQYHRVQWDEGVLDNELLERKKSKICCIYHKPRGFGESSSESLEYSDSEMDEKDANCRPRTQKRGPRKTHKASFYRDRCRGGDKPSPPQLPVQSKK